MPKAPNPRTGAWLLIQLGISPLLPADNTIITVILYVLLGITVGTLSGLIGIGGGVIIVPALALFYGLHQDVSHQIRDLLWLVFGAELSGIGVVPQV